MDNSVKVKFAMTGSLIDLYSGYGMRVLEGLSSLLSLPSLQPVYSNDWAEEDGLEVDLSEPHLDSRSLTLDVSFDTYTNKAAFLTRLRAAKYHLFYFAATGRYMKLRYVGESNVDAVSPVTCRLKFADDFPLSYVGPTGIVSQYTYVEPIERPSLPSGWVMSFLDDGVTRNSDLNEYSIFVADGVYDVLLNQGDDKGVHVSNTGQKGGATAFGKPHRAGMDMAITCHMVVDDMATLNRNLMAFLYDLVRPNVHTLKDPTNMVSWQFYYQKCDISEMCISDGKIVATMKLTLKRI